MEEEHGRGALLLPVLGGVLERIGEVGEVENEGEDVGVLLLGVEFRDGLELLRGTSEELRDGELLGGAGDLGGA